jgi:ribonuclease P protein component
MLKKINRLTKDKEFDRAFKKGRSGYDKIVGVKITANDLEINRFGILISAKISKKAVIRNKIKRQIREIIRLEMDKLKQGNDCVIICLPEIVSKEYGEIEKSILGHFRKLKMYK